MPDRIPIKLQLPGKSRLIYLLSGKPDEKMLEVDGVMRIDTASLLHAKEPKVNSGSISPTPVAVFQKTFNIFFIFTKVGFVKLSFIQLL